MSNRQRSKYSGASGQRVARRSSDQHLPRSLRLLGAGHPATEPEPRTERRATNIQKRIPGCTYRLQFNSGFKFTQALAIADYLHDLGVTDCYASPLFKARPKSTHGYDVCGHGELSAEIGTNEDFEDLTDSLRSRGMGLLLDIVPNHMSADCSNAWWFDVLQNGSHSQYAKWFDIDWKSASAATAGKVLLPILEDHYARVLEAGKLRIAEEGGKFFLHYYDRRFPISTQSSRLLKQQVAKRGLKETLVEINGRPGEPASFNTLDHLLRHQNYRLAFWRIGPEEINYRRFFDVTELVSLRVELPEVFKAAHEFVFHLIRKGRVTGLRVDHPDGLWDPRQYFDRLQREFAADDTVTEANADQPSKAESQREKSQSRLYVVAEKILTSNESLPDDWEVDGTTGYDFLAQLNGLFVDPANESGFDRIYNEFSGNRQSFRTIIYESRKRILQTSLLSELNATARRLKDISSLTRYGLDFTSDELREAVIEVVSCFPVYRSYVNERTVRVGRADRQHIRRAVEEARRVNPHAHAAAIDFLGHILALELPDDVGDEGTRQIREFVMKFQQLTGPAAAKGIEDTSFYNYNRLVSLNEVGGDPDKFGISISEFHERNLARAERWSHSLLATATHDTKRGEDVRARLNVLSEVPREWSTRLKRWRELNARRKTIVSNEAAPHPNDEYLFYQMLLGTWTREADSADGLLSITNRLIEYMTKAMREAKARTSWTHGNAEYEKAVEAFIKAVLKPGANDEFVRDFNLFQSRVAYFGRFNSLSQTALKLTCPGVPDIYQGCEMWDFGMVDPDNRRPVNFDVRRKALARIRKLHAKSPTTLISRLKKDWQTGEEKLWLVWRLLQFRNARSDLFQTGTYVPLRAMGGQSHHVCAFARVHGDEVAIAIVPRLVCGLLKGEGKEPSGPDVWGDTAVVLPAELKTDALNNVLTGEKFSDAKNRIPVASALQSFPIAVLSNNAP
jgi:(1->4)-alpha-D-glucan 1-alpha-D-glucosylmutase